MKKGLIFVVSGPSGSGKTTLIKEVLQDEELKRKLAKSVSLTTRPKRAGEKNGQDYFFISDKEFRGQRRAKKLIEWTRYLGYYYGSSKGLVDSVLAKGKNIILCLDLKGALSIQRLYPQQTKTIFVVPPSLGALRTRIAKRCRIANAKEVKQRLQLAHDELEASRIYDYSVMNKDLSRAVARLKDIILKEISKKYY